MLPPERVLKADHGQALPGFVHDLELPLQRHQACYPAARFGGSNLAVPLADRLAGLVTKLEAIGAQEFRLYPQFGG